MASGWRTAESKLHLDALIRRSCPDAFNALHGLEKSHDAVLAPLAVKPLIADDFERHGSEHECTLWVCYAETAAGTGDGLTDGCPTPLIASKK